MSGPCETPSDAFHKKHLKKRTQTHTHTDRERHRDTTLLRLRSRAAAAGQGASGAPPPFVAPRAFERSKGLSGRERERETWNFGGFRGLWALLLLLPPLRRRRLPPAPHTSCVLQGCKPSPPDFCSGSGVICSEPPGRQRLLRFRRSVRRVDG